MAKLIFLKLGGSLITDKATPQTPRREVIVQLVEEIKAWKEGTGESRLILGHGSGSFGHVPAKKYGTRQGVDSPEEWLGFAEVWHEAVTLNQIVMDVLHEASLPGVSFPASGGATTRNGKIASWDLAPLQAALDHDLLPVVYGDVVFDTVCGGTILSTEDIFTHLARKLHPQRILLAGIDDGVFADYPQCTRLIPEVTPENWETVSPVLRGSQATDVTGGMESKVRSMLALTEEIAGLEVVIFNGNPPENLAAALQGKSPGTRITSKNSHTGPPIH